MFIRKLALPRRIFLKGLGTTLALPLLDAMVERSAAFGVREIVLGMPHRGRLNVLANTLNKPYSMIFGEFEENLLETVGGDGDVKYHLGFSADHITAEQKAASDYFPGFWDDRGWVEGKIPNVHRRPGGLSAEGLPLGLQLIGRPFDEETLFSLAQVIEDSAGRFTPTKWW